jgi:hypothetical protein
MKDAAFEDPAAVDASRAYCQRIRTDAGALVFRTTGTDSTRVLPPAGTGRGDQPRFIGRLVIDRPVACAR